METYALSQLLQQQQQTGSLWLEFLRHDSLSMGVYVLPAGGTDPQSPHTEDEVYYIAGGRGQIFVGGEDRAVKTGDIIFVAKQVEHRFHSIEEELRILVFFAPAEGTGQA
jgi:mannose-6-phosphate isomerase-like protein (cupin superfamily)